ncbi:MAG: hypothetical protein MHPSP_001342, partial [Paramarteilia canceri]
MLIEPKKTCPDGKGRFGSKTGPNCIDCPFDKYSHNQSIECTPCPVGSIRDIFSNEYSSSSKSCSYCKPEYYKEDGKCLKCGSNLLSSWIPSIQNGCKIRKVKCPDHMVQAKNERCVSCNTIMRGSYKMVGKGSLYDACKCKKDFYIDINSYGRRKCLPCQKNSESLAEGIGQKFCLCKPGYFKTNVGDKIQCKMCPKDSFNRFYNSEVCEKCPYFSNTDGTLATSRESCIPNGYKQLVIAVICIILLTLAIGIILLCIFYHQQIFEPLRQIFIDMDTDM